MSWAFSIEPGVNEKLLRRIRSVKYITDSAGYSTAETYALSYIVLIIHCPQHNA